MAITDWWKRLSSFFSDKSKQQDTEKEEDDDAQYSYPVDWTREDIHELVFARVRGWMDPQYDPKNIELHEVREEFNAVFTESNKRFEHEDSEDDPESDYATYALIAESAGKNTILKSWIYDQSGLQEISVQDFENRINSRHKGTYAIWQYHLFEFTIQTNLRKIDFGHGESSMATRSWRDIIVREEGELKLEIDPKGYFMMT